MVKIRLQRHGRKKAPYYHVVVADSRKKRDGRIVEDLGRYNPHLDPAMLKINADRAMYWIKTGAQTSETVERLLRREGIYYRLHLERWNKTPEEIEETIAKWKADRDARSDYKTSTTAQKKAALKAEEEAVKAAEQKRAEEAAKKAEEERIAKEKAEKEAAAAAKAAEAEANEKAEAKESEAAEEENADAKAETTEEVVEADAKEEATDEAVEAKEEAAEKEKKK